MKLIDAIKNVIIPNDANVRDWQCDADYEAVNESLEIFNMWSGWSEELNKRIRAYPIYQWQCTDTWVGLKAIYFDGKPAGASYQSARKSSVNVRWLSLEIARAVREAILSTVETKIDLINPEEDIGEDFSVQYAGEALSDDGFYQGRPVRALVYYESYTQTTPQQYRRPGHSYTESVPYEDPKNHCVKILDEGCDRVIPVNELRFRFNVREPG